MGCGETVAKFACVGLPNGSDRDSMLFASIVACFTASLYGPLFFLLKRICNF